MGPKERSGKHMNPSAFKHLASIYLTERLCTVGLGSKHGLHVISHHSSSFTVQSWNLEQIASPSLCFLTGRTEITGASCVLQCRKNRYADHVMALPTANPQTGHSPHGFSWESGVKATAPQHLSISNRAFQRVSKWSKSFWMVTRIPQWCLSEIGLGLYEKKRGSLEVYWCKTKKWKKKLFGNFFVLKKEYS